MPPLDPSSARYARQRILTGFGSAAQQRLTDARVLVIGAGGLGSAILPALAAAGVGTLDLIDDDTVDETNLHRQTLHGPSDVGRLKVDSAADALAAIAPDVATVRHGIRFTGANALELLLDVDLLIDASDNTETRYLANDIAAIRGIPLVWGSALGYAGQVGVAWDEKGLDYRDLFPEPGDDADLSCEVAGVLPTVCTVIGGFMATEALKLLTGIGEPLLGRVVLYDALSGRTRELEYHRDDAAPRPGSVEQLTAEPNRVESDQSISAADLAALLAGPNPPQLLDVRTPEEAAIASLPGSALIPLAELPARYDELDRDRPLVVYCHHGIRSANALVKLTASGFPQARHLTGGIEAWATQVDPSVPRY